MALLKFNLILFLLTIGYIEQVTSQCSSPFSNGDVTNFCYYYKSTPLSWLDSYNQCLNKPIEGILIQILTIDQFNALKNANIDGKNLFWLGANNFASFVDSQWYWLDGSIVDNSIIPWCSYSTYETAIGAQCIAYDSASQCITNYLCSTLLTAPCVSTQSFIKNQAKNILNTRSLSTSVCTNSYGGAYANWWTYSILLLNWFILFCFILYLISHFNMNKCIIILIISIMIISFMMIIAFAILWGVQYRDIIKIPLIVVILGCIASVAFLIDILILVSNRTYIQRWIACMIITIITIIIECLLMLGLILCIAYCSAYISLPSTSLDKDIIAALLAAIIAAISIIFYNGILYLIGQDRLNTIRTHNRNPNNSVPIPPTQAIIPRQSYNNNGVNPRATAKNHAQIERATSPVDARILNEFYSDQPKDMHKYQLEGRQYVVYEGKTFNDTDQYRKDLTQAMLLQESQGLREAIARVKNSDQASILADEIRQAENLLNRLK